MDNNRSSWGSNLGFLLAAIGSAVGLGNIWGFPYKMGKSGGFTFLIVYLFLAIFVGMIIMVSELAVGRKTKLSPIDAYKKVSQKFAWIGWLATIAPFFIMSFYTVLGGYCLQYIALNMTKLSFGNEAVAMSGGDVFGAIFKGAFAAKAAGGGIVGYGIKLAIEQGMKRGVFSNEAGLGSSVMVHSNSNVKEPVKQGMWGIFEVFADTIIVCTMTAFSVLSSGLVESSM